MNDNKYIALNLANRIITMGGNTVFISADKVWDYLKELSTGRRVHHIEDGNNYKNAHDKLRVLVGTENIRDVVQYVRGGYKLRPSVKVEGGSQVAIRSTKQAIENMKDVECETCREVMKVNAKDEPPYYCRDCDPCGRQHNAGKPRHGLGYLANTGSD